jgi:hypothetical protein
VVGGEVIALSAVCLAGLLAGVFVIARWGGLPTRAGGRAPDPLGGDRGSVVLLRYLRSCAIAASAGAIAGVLVGGLGGRLAMRVLAATSGDDVQGALTDAEERVGDVTVGGTVGLVIFIGVFGGILGGLVFVALRRWLPERAWLAGLAFGALILFVARLDPLDPESIDLQVLSPRLLAVLLFLALFPLYGMVLASLVAGFDRGYPVLAARVRAMAAYLPLVPFLLLGPPAAVLAIGGGVSLVASKPSVSRVWSGATVDWVGRLVLGVAGALGVVWVAFGVRDIFSG